MLCCQKDARGDDEERTLSSCATVLRTAALATNAARPAGCTEQRPTSSGVVENTHCLFGRGHAVVDKAPRLHHFARVKQSDLGAGYIPKGSVVGWSCRWLLSQEPMVVLGNLCVPAL